MTDSAAQFPPAFLEQLALLSPDDDGAALAAALLTPRVLAVRVNTLRATPDEVLAELRAAGLAPEPVSWSAEAFTLPADALRALQDTAAYTEARVLVQGLSSQLVPLLLAPRPGEAVLDLCAAPGGKTSQIAALMQGTGRLHANDRSQARVYRLRDVLGRAGADFVTTSARAGESFGRREPDAWDRVLLDAPCSMEGRRALDDGWKGWSPQLCKRLASEQERLLLSALTTVRLGGEVIYSTCTMSPRENERVVSRVLRRRAGEVRLAPIELPEDIPQRAGLTEWRGKPFRAEGLELCRRVLPSERTEAFFVARFVREG